MRQTITFSHFDEEHIAQIASELGTNRFGHNTLRVFDRSILSGSLEAVLDAVRYYTHVCEMKYSELAAVVSEITPLHFDVVLRCKDEESPEAQISYKELEIVPNFTFSSIKGAETQKFIFDWVILFRSSSSKYMCGLPKYTDVLGEIDFHVENQRG